MQWYERPHNGFFSMMITYLMLQEFIQTKGYPSWTNVTCVREGAETPLFKQNFSNWLNKGETTTLVKTPTRTAGMTDV